MTELMKEMRKRDERRIMAKQHAAIEEEGEDGEEEEAKEDMFVENMRETSKERTGSSKQKPKPKSGQQEGEVR